MDDKMDDKLADLVSFVENIVNEANCIIGEKPFWYMPPIIKDSIKAWLIKEQII